MSTTALRRAARALGVALLASVGALALAAAPATAAPCLGTELSLQATLTPGGSEARTVTVEVAPGSTLRVGDPVASGDLAPDLSSTLHWCEGTECTPQTGESLAPGSTTAVPDGEITFVFTVTLDPASTRQNAAGSVRQPVQVISDGCAVPSAPPSSPGSGPGDGAGSGPMGAQPTGQQPTGAQTDAAAPGRPTGELGATGQSLQPVLWSAASLAVGALLWALARRRRAEER